MVNMPEKGITKIVGDAATALGMRPTLRITHYPPERQPMKHSGDSYEQAVSEVDGYSVQQLAADPRTKTEITIAVANGLSTKDYTQIQKTKGIKHKKDRNLNLFSYP